MRRQIIPAVFLLLCAGLIASALWTEYLPQPFPVACLIAFAALAHGLAIVGRKQRHLLLGTLDTQGPGTVPHVPLLLLGLVYLLAMPPLADVGIVGIFAFFASALMTILTVAFSNWGAAEIGKKVRVPAISTLIAGPSPNSIEPTGKSILFNLRAATLTASFVGLLSVAIGSFDDDAVFGLFAVQSIILLTTGFTLVLSRKILDEKLRLFSEGRLLRLVAHIEKLKPEMVVHFSAPLATNAKTLIDWLPHLRSLKRPFFIVLRDRKHFNELSKLKVPNLVLVTAMSDLERYLVKSLRAAVYVNNDAKNSHFVRFGSIAHINLIPFKPYCEKSLPSSYRMYTHLFVPSQIVADMSIHKGGFPATAFGVLGKRLPSNVLQFHPISKDVTEATTLAYFLSPVSRGKSRDWSTIARMSKIITQKVLSSENSFKLVMHASAVGKSDKYPVSTFKEIRENLAKSRKGGNNGVLYESKIATSSTLNGADVIITDIASDFVDLRQSGTPIVLTDILGMADELLPSDVRRCGCYLLNEDLSNFDEILMDATGRDTLRAERLAAREYILGIPQRGPSPFAETFGEVLDPIVERNFEQLRTAV